VSPEAVVAEIDRVAAAGFKEIALTGVHLGSYGRDLEPRTSLIALLHVLDRESHGVLFRISSLEPMDCSRAIVDLVERSPHFAPHFHLPLQHASNAVLARMRRPYTIGYYAALVEDIRARMPAASIGTDLIVGFPGETDSEFDELASYLERSPLTHVHVFPYSDRPGTDAAAMGGKVHGAVIRERGQRVRDIARRLTNAFRESQLGSVRRGLTLEDGTLVVTDNYLKVRIPPGLARNLWVRVAITPA
jgi:threonylcarbamoyladenosine tRNA methylthiotransferase MtaB